MLQQNSNINFTLIIDRDSISVCFVFVAFILYYLLCRRIAILCHTVSQELTIISPSNFLGILSNVWRRADAKIRWPLRTTLTRDLDLTINVHFGPYLSTCWTEHLQIFTQTSYGYGHSNNLIKSIAICTKSIMGTLCFRHLAKTRFWS